MSKNQVKPRRIIVCLDGTWETPSEKSNVYKFSQLLVDGEVIDHKGDLWEQVHTYYTGLGTNKYRILGGVFGYGISGQILSAYKYICQNYRNANDEIWLLGFSRGAYAVRSLAGMINNVGLLPQKGLSKVGQAYTLYRNRGKRHRPNGVDSVKFRMNNNCQIPSINFLGCFDTVGALGVPKLPWYFGGPIFYNLFHGLHSFHDTKLAPTVKHAYHALSIHDQRAWFRPTLMHFSDKRHVPESQVLEQVWFPGMHADVGGQQSSKHTGNVISCHSLNWMLLKARALGLVLKDDKESRTCDYSNCKFFFEDSYLSALIYRIMPREDRVIERDETTCSYDPKVQLYLRGDFLSFLTKDNLRRYKSKSLAAYYEEVFKSELG